MPGAFVPGFFIIMWGDLSASEKAELMRIFINSGIRDLSTMRNIYEEEFRGGGDIHIKPSHKGRFTSLLRRTGKSASWYKAHGTPAQRKMATFALNARKWHHGDGGYIADDEEYFGGTLPAATKVAWLPEVQSPEGKAIASNMAERVASGKMDLGDVPRRYYNYVQGEAQGAIPMRGYMDKATNVALGTLAVPLATMAAAEAAPVLAPGSALWSNPITQQALASEIGGRAVDLISKDFTGKTWAENMSGAFDKVTGLNSSDSFVGQSIAEMTNPGYLLSPSHFISKVGINRLPQAAFDSYANRLVKEGFTPSPSVATERPKLQQFPEVVRTTPKQELPPYEIEDLGGGYMLRSLMRGNPLEKQLSKQGTVNINNVKALINKGSDIEKTIVDKVLSGNEFANKKTIDYNKFRKAVQDELITYDRTPDKRFNDYGMEKLGVQKIDPDGPVTEGESRNFNNYVNQKCYRFVEDWPGSRSKHFEDAAGNYISYKDIIAEYNKENEVNTNTYTFSSSRIPTGSAKHYDANTLGHSRTYTTAKEPDILYVMESQSDWAQSGVAQEIKGDLAQSNDLIETYQWRINQLEKEISTGSDQLGFPIGEEAMADKRKILDDVKTWLAWELERNKELASTNSAQAKYLSDNYTTKQIQENLKYAAEQGQTKMRYPTRETAATVEGYVKEYNYYDNNGKSVSYDDAYTRGEDIEKRISELTLKRSKIGSKIPNGNAEYLRDFDAYEDFIERRNRVAYDMISHPEDYEAGAGERILQENLDHRNRLKWMREHPNELREIIREEGELTEQLDKLKMVPKKLRPGFTQVLDYPAAYEPILKKYDAFPKQFKKLYKNADVRTVTDSRGNTWYEVDVPENYLDQEWQYRLGDGNNDISHLMKTLRKASIRINANHEINRARQYKNSDQYKQLVEDAIKESNEMGIGRFPKSLFIGSEQSKNPTISFSSKNKGTLGSYQRGLHNIDLDLNQIGNEKVVYHEGLHAMNIGRPEVDTKEFGPLYQNWIDLLDQNASTKEADNAFDKFYDFGGRGYAKFEQRGKAIDYIDKKVSNALKPNASLYLRNIGELQVNGLEAGRALGIKPFEKYPGKTKAKEMIRKARKYNSYLDDVKAESDEDIKNFWKILTGQYTPVVGIGILGTSGLINNKE